MFPFYNSVQPINFSSAVFQVIKRRLLVGKKLTDESTMSLYLCDVDFSSVNKNGKTQKIARAFWCRFSLSIYLVAKLLGHLLPFLLVNGQLQVIIRIASIALCIGYQCKFLCK